MRQWLNQAGVTNIDEVRFQPTRLTADPEGGLEKAKRVGIARFPYVLRSNSFR
jgi:FMN-dependent NADH-azoreductase